MEKMSYNVVYKNTETNSVKTQDVVGYVFVLDGARFGLSKQEVLGNGSVRTTKRWTITELTSGMAVRSKGCNTFQTRDDAALFLLDNPDVLKLIVERLETFTDNVNPDIRPHDTIVLVDA